MGWLTIINFQDTDALQSLLGVLRLLVKGKYEVRDEWNEILLHPRTTNL